MTSRMREAALQYGTNARDWPESAQREAVAELFLCDEREQYPGWQGDCLAERIAADRDKRLEIIGLVNENDTLRRLCGLGAILDDALRDYPLDTISELCALHMADWRAGERLSEYRLDADSREKAERECAA